MISETFGRLILSLVWYYIDMSLLDLIKFSHLTTAMSATTLVSAIGINKSLL